MKEVQVTKDEIANSKDLEALFESKLITKVDVISYLDEIPLQSKEALAKSNYYHTVSILMQQNLFMMKVYLSLYQKEVHVNSNIVRMDNGSGKIYIGQVNQIGVFNGKGVLLDGNFLYAGFWANGIPSGFFYVFKNGV